MSDDSLATFACPQCGRHWTWTPQLAGKAVKCGCGRVFRVPGQVEPTAAPAEDAYDLAAAAPVAAHIAVHGQPLVTSPAVSSAHILNYERPSPEGRVQVYDAFEGDKSKNLYVPLAMILGALPVLYVEIRLFALLSGSPGHGYFFMIIAFRVCVSTPAFLLACVIATKIADVYFGPIGPAMLKICAIALVTMVFLPLLDFGPPLGWAISLFLYCRLFQYFFDFEFGEALRVTIIVWFINYWVDLVWLTSVLRK